MVIATIYRKRTKVGIPQLPLVKQWEQHSQLFLPIINIIRLQILSAGILIGLVLVTHIVIIVTNGLTVVLSLILTGIMGLQILTVAALLCPLLILIIGLHSIAITVILHYVNIVVQLV